MVAIERQRVIRPNAADGFSQLIGEAGTGVTIENKELQVKRARLTLSGAVITVTQALDYGSLKIVDLPDTNLMLLGMELDLVVTKQGNTNGIVAASDLDMAVGTAPASNATLSGTMLDVIEKADLDTDALAVDFNAHSNDQATALFPRKIGDNASSALYLNLAVAITADSSVTVDGTIDIYYVDVGGLN